MRIPSILTATALFVTGALAAKTVVTSTITKSHTTYETVFATTTKTFTDTDGITITTTISKTVMPKVTPTTTITAYFPSYTTKSVTSTEVDTVTSTVSFSSTTTATTTVTEYSATTITETASASTVTETLPASTVTQTITASGSSCSSSSATTTSSSGTTPTPTSSSSSSSNPASSPTTSSTSTSSAPSGTVTPGSKCYVTAYSAVSAAVASCTAITLDSVNTPGNSTLDLSKLKANTVVTFVGLTTFGYFPWTGNLINIGGTNITIQGATDHVIDGNGQSWWDGQGSNGGMAKPDHFIAVSKALGTSYIQNLYIQNYPTHCFYVSNSQGLTLQNIFLNNSAGYAPNNISNGLPAAHNTDGFDLSTTNNTILRNSTVLNQDDCVAITSGVNVTVDGMYCNGSHGLSIGSVGGKSNNYVANIVFSNSECDNCQNGARIKSNYNTTGTITNITYSNIYLSEATTYGIDIQQDYLNGGPTGNPSNGVTISNIYATNVTGTATSSAQDYYILCGSGSCSNFVFNDINVVGGGVASSCNYRPTGDFVCD